MRDLSVADEYRTYAADCVRLAQSATHDDDRARLLAIAQAWRELAEKLENGEAE